MEFDEVKCLQVNPFEGDFGSPGDKVLKDKIVTARKSRPCGMCRQYIAPGERVRTLAAIFDGDMKDYVWCSTCCHALSINNEDDGKSWEAQVSKGNDKRFIG